MFSPCCCTCPGRHCSARSLCTAGWPNTSAKLVLKVVEVAKSDSSLRNQRFATSVRQNRTLRSFVPFRRRRPIFYVMVISVAKESEIVLVQHAWHDDRRRLGRVLLAGVIRHCRSGAGQHLASEFQVWRGSRTSTTSIREFIDSKRHANNQHSNHRETVSASNNSWSALAPYIADSTPLLLAPCSSLHTM